MQSYVDVDCSAVHHTV